MYLALDFCVFPLIIKQGFILKIGEHDQQNEDREEHG